MRQNHTSVLARAIAAAFYRAHRDEALEKDSVVIDSVGIVETTALANKRFEAIALDYFLFWASETEGNSNEFGQWLVQLQELVGREISDVWQKSEWHGAWFDRACREKVDAELARIVSGWTASARWLEMQKLANPQ